MAATERILCQAYMHLARRLAYTVGGLEPLH